MELKIVERFDEEELIVANEPVIFRNIFEDYPSLMEINEEKYFETIQNVPITLIELDVQNLTRQKNKINAHDAITLIKKNMDPRKKYSISSINDQYFSKGFRDSIPLPQAVKKSNYYSLNMWFGEKGYITPLHFDVTRGVLYQLKGRKVVKLISVEQTKYMYRHNFQTGGGFNFSQIPSLTRVIDLEKYPFIKQITPVEVILNSGEMLFIPPGWWHEVSYAENSISLNYWYDIKFDKGPTWLLLGLLACNYNNLYPFKYDDVMAKILEAQNQGAFSAAKIMVGSYLESIMAEKFCVSGSFLGNVELDKIGFSNTELQLLRTINDFILDETSIKDFF